jgi:hypothetical protein
MSGKLTSMSCELRSTKQSSCCQSQAAFQKNKVIVERRVLFTCACPSNNPLTPLSILTRFSTNVRCVSRSYIELVKPEARIYIYIYNINIGYNTDHYVSKKFVSSKQNIFDL